MDLDSNSNTTELYGDIDKVGLEFDYQRLMRENDQLKSQVEALTTENSELHQNLSDKVKEKSIIEQNIVAVYNTGRTSYSQ